MADTPDIAAAAAAPPAFDSYSVSVFANAQLEIPGPPGELSVPGTRGGGGAARSPQRWLKPGERVSVTIEGIGTLTNPVVAAS